MKGSNEPYLWKFQKILLQIHNPQSSIREPIIMCARDDSAGCDCVSWRRLPVLKARATLSSWILIVSHLEWRRLLNEINLFTFDGSVFFLAADNFNFNRNRRKKESPFFWKSSSYQHLIQFTWNVEHRKTENYDWIEFRRN